MSYLNELITAILLLIPLGGGLRAVYCLIKMAMDEEQRSLYKRRLNNLLAFVIVAECIVALLYLVLAYIT